MTNRPGLPSALSLSYGTLGLVTAGTGAGLIWGAANLQSPTTYSTAGPELFPYLIGGGLVLLGLLVLLDVIRKIVPGEFCVELRWSSMAWVLGGLLVHLSLVETLGWIFASTLLFMMGARGFGSRRPFADLVLGLGLAIGTVLLFQTVLGLRLPSGPFSIPF